MRNGTFNYQSGRIGIALALLILTAIAATTATSGLHITAGDVEMSMNVSSDSGLQLRFGRAADV
ncbi:MAG: hypothetical protein MRY64_08780 [Hyphomonadaceae bacterium]|nr:hypothetical protein [Hyphomonadaceae bacterium]